MSENSSVGQKHPYHLVDPSPLPFLRGFPENRLSCRKPFVCRRATSPPSA